MIEDRVVLVVDDEPGHRLMVRAVLEDDGWTVLEASSGERALTVLAESAESGTVPDVALVDMKMPGMDGMQLLKELQMRRQGMPVVLLTAFGSVGSAVDAMKRGAFDYLTKPADNDELTVVLGKAFEYHKLVRENVRLKAEVGGDLNFIGASPGVERVRDLIAQAGPSEATVLILGQSGTGKELVAEGLHRASNRASRPLIKVNCAALPDDLLESELFGYEKGAFTGAVKDKPGRFQLADGGTLFLDEIGEMPGALQAKLLRVLQEKTIEPLGSVRTIKVDTRIIAATNRDLKREVEAGRFREDLYYRLAVLEIRIPPLCERKEDLPLLVSFLMRKLGNKNNKIIRTVTPAFLDALSGYDWPGNVRELENVLERALILSRSDALGPDLLPPQVSGAREAAVDLGPGFSHAMTSPASLEEAEKLAILRALEENGNHRERTADALGISRRTLQYKLKKFGLTRR
ncbi:MAG: sigma-54 dependent transcriptional regulator [Pseudodesulfovibrio sp.]|uniref:Sigma-54 factor interaction domain-containing protein n=1 Tax=Pseudodesulfovibrio aespoeensis (strain ATCC 700646 / DSM 10631 / Aspo-2) TaxID=643562 RepID=E6VXI9_PSEA9|nr:MULTISPECIES: sigma-54 dependent transcriptional regulator [Pseudodesulfovibrio]MBU4193044.1 sigma-54 dependent transcriptional regulator [Pseudomonadota bacterium]ADU63805.1 sigma-54 factor interaction domain-containing protein [Pseudodesulfovibrio aespoeensis Aspo-2]MBU4242935.1 sigma-54 dependent transcriptional regulator [Pseudomonadota bacterium]MBU4475609.1 sigma-54 dependent transcriptional regulator [Pseudomonadota bacterium]MBU4515039.1 sigma-54 dependent transcriptional regulator 